MRSRTGVLLSWGLGTTLVLVLGACGVESLDEGARPLDDEALQEEQAALTQESQALAPPWDLYADAVAPGTTAAVLNPSRALGAPDGQAATVLGLLNSSLVLDLGQGEEGTGDLRVYYRGLTVALVAQVEFVKADGMVAGAGPLRLVELGVGTHVAVVSYPGTGPYRYVRLRGVLLALYQVDAVETSLRPFCGDGVLAEGEACDDDNQLSGDGCNSVCQVEPGYTCAGQPSVCVDIDECALGTDTCAPEEVCVNTPGGFECEEAPTCAPPRIVCAQACVDPRTDNNHCGACGNVCGQGKACSSGVCLGTGNLQFTATWGRNGDADLYVRTPTGKVIFFGNRGPNAGTDFGELDVDDQAGDGPENIFWALDRTPPSGTYDFCLRVGSFNPAPSPAAPVSYSIRVNRTGQPDFEFVGQFTQLVLFQTCSPGQLGYIGSLPFP